MREIQVPHKRTSHWVLIFAVYFVVHGLIRTSIGWRMTPDEIQILQDGQKFAWLYSGEMPLYAWLQASVFNTFGVSILSLTLLKNMILLMICLSVFTAVERVSDEKWALTATISLLFVPQLAWTSQHSMTSPVLATLFAATTMVTLTKLIQSKSARNYLILGAMIGLGAISATSYIIVPLALILASITSSQFRNIFASQSAE